MHSMTVVTELCCGCSVVATAKRFTCLHNGYWMVMITQARLKNFSVHVMIVSYYGPSDLTN